MFTYNTGIPRFSKVHFMPLQFNKGPTLAALVFRNQKKPEEDFCFYKGETQRQCPGLVFQWAPAEAVCTQAGRAAPPSSSLGTTLGIWASTCIALNCVCEQLCFISIYFVHPFSKMCPKVSDKAKRSSCLHLGMLKSFSVSINGNSFFVLRYFSCWWVS